MTLRSAREEKYIRGVESKIRKGEGDLAPKIMVQKGRSRQAKKYQDKER